MIHLVQYLVQIIWRVADHTLLILNLTKVRIRETRSINSLIHWWVMFGVLLIFHSNRWNVQRLHRIDLFLSLFVRKHLWSYILQHTKILAILLATIRLKIILLTYQRLNLPCLLLVLLLKLLVLLQQLLVESLHICVDLYTLLLASVLSYLSDLLRSGHENPLKNLI